jgi:aryl-alcohol dehydrogenase-like predicted oxidoreductase
MQHTDIGALCVSRIGFGAYGMGGAYGQAEPSTWRAQVHLAMELGITYFDTAPTYGEAELWLGEWLGPVRNQLVLATKCGVTEEGGRDASAAAVVRSCERSLRRLRTDWIDLYQIHFDDPDVPVLETLTALDALRRKGMIREYGLCHLPVERAAEYVRLGEPASVLMEYSLLAQDESTRELLAMAREAGVAVVAFSPTGRGLLSGEITRSSRFGQGDIRNYDPLFAGERRTAGIELSRRLAAAAGPANATAAQAAIAWVLAQPGVAAALTGPARAQHLRDNAGAADLRLADGTVGDLGRAAGELAEAALRSAVRAMRQTLSCPLAQGEAVRVSMRLLLEAMETLIQAGMASEARVMPLAMRLLRPGRDKSPLSSAELESIRTDLAALAEAAAVEQPPERG